MNAAGTDLLPINDGILLRPDRAQTRPGMIHHFDVPAEPLLHPRDNAAFLGGTVGPEVLEAGIQRGEEALPTAMVVAVGFMDEIQPWVSTRSCRLRPLTIVATQPPF
jgi:hypothetical protein